MAKIMLAKIEKIMYNKLTAGRVVATELGYK
jgi:hypothetical protein